MTPLVSRGDLLRLLDVLSEEQLRRVAGVAGFDVVSPPVAPGQDPRGAAPESPPAKRGPVKVVVPEPAGVVPDETPVPFLRLESMTFHERLAAPAPTVVLSTAELTQPVRWDALPKTPPLVPWSRLWASLQALLRRSGTGGVVDVPEVVRRLARGRRLDRIPQKPRLRWPERLVVWADLTTAMAPFWRDQEDVLRRLVRVVGKRSVRLRVLEDRHLWTAATRQTVVAGTRAWDPAVPLLVMSDLGAHGAPGVSEVWLRTGRRLARDGAEPVVMLPGATPADEQRGWQSLRWESGQRREGVESLLDDAALASFAPWGLLRALRRRLPRARADAGAEWAVGTHADVEAADGLGVLLRAEAVQRRRVGWAERYRKAPEEPGLRAHLGAVWRDLHDWLAPLSGQLLHWTVLAWAALFPGFEGPSPREVDEAKRFVLGLDGMLRAKGASRHVVEALRGPCQRALGEVPREVYGDVELREALCRMYGRTRGEQPGAVPPPGYDPARHEDDTQPVEARFWALRQRGNRLVIRPSPSAAWPVGGAELGSPVAWFLAASPRVLLRRGVAGDWHELPLEDGAELELDGATPLELRSDASHVRLAWWRIAGDPGEDDWAEEAGRDAFGLWAQANVAGVPQRFRWIPPGRFWMGSPPGEVGSFDDERPQHLVTWTRGRWLAETPVTQALWTAVMGANPSRFQDPKRPVENVSWTDCKQFLAALPKHAKALHARLPSEAEWEHACRAGTPTATWLGDLDLRGENDAPILDAIAWYGGNSGKDFDLANGEAVWWSQKQYAFDKAGTRAVAQKAPNPFGLFDMLGNVYDWCEDMQAPYAPTSLVDPEANRVGHRRVIRGGSWGGVAGYCRAAGRYWLAPEDRDDFVGFRLARGPDPVRGAEPLPRSGSGRGAGGATQGAPSTESAGRPDKKRSRKGPRA